jgi:hypothetical protein
MGVGRGWGRRMEVNKWLPSFVGMKRKPKKGKKRVKDRTQKRNRSEVIRKDLYQRKKNPWRQTPVTGQVR